MVPPWCTWANSYLGNRVTSKAKAIGTYVVPSWCNRDSFYLGNRDTSKAKEMGHIWFLPGAIRTLFTGTIGTLP